MAEYYDGLLELCGFEDTDIEPERPRLEKAFNKLGLVQADFQNAEVWVKKNHHEMYGHPAVYVDGSMDSRWGEFPGYVPERVEYLGSNIEKIFIAVRDILGVEVTEEARRVGATRGREVTGVLNELVEIMKTAHPQPISVVTVELARRITIGSTSQRILSEAPAAIALLNKEVKEKIGKGVGVVEKGAHG